MSSFKTAAWAKTQPERMRLISVLRYVLLGWPLIAAFYLLELVHRRTPKDHVLFVIPYDEYDENTRYLFELCRARHLLSHKIVLFVFHDELYETLRERFEADVVFARSKRGFETFFRSSLAFTSRGALINAFYPYYFHRRFKVFVNLWHGIPLKRIGRLAKASWESIIKLEAQHYASMTVCSAAEQLAMALANDMPIDRVWITNTPRNDPLFASRGPQRTLDKEEHRVRTILYAPTYRDGSNNTELFPFDDFDEAKLVEFLTAHDARLIVRRHLLEHDLWNRAGLHRHNRILLDDRRSLYDSLQQELIDSDVLLTDYSSVYLDYVILDRPIIFIPYDRADYEQKRGFVFDYDKMSPGPKVSSFAQLLNALELALSQPGMDAEWRRRVRDYFHEQQDGRAGERIIERALRELRRFDSREYGALASGPAVPPFSAANM